MPPGLKTFLKAHLPTVYWTLLRTLRSDARRLLSDAAGLLARPWRFRNTHRYVKRLLNSAAPIDLEIGALTKEGRDGWTTLDLTPHCDIQWDLRWPLPFPESSVSKIYSSHVLEHFEYPQLLDLLHECHRILTPGGLFLACVPNASIYVSAYSEPSGFEAERYCLYQPAYHYHSDMDYVNYIAYMAGEHRFMFDEENVIAILTEAGFPSARLREFDPTVDLESRHRESIYVEAEK